MAFRFLLTMGNSIVRAIEKIPVTRDVEKTLRLARIALGVFIGTLLVILVSQITIAICLIILAAQGR